MYCASIPSYSELVSMFMRAEQDGDRQSRMRALMAPMQRPEIQSRPFLGKRPRADSPPRLMAPPALVRRPSVWCAYCKRPGHTEVTCFTRMRDSIFSPPQRINCQLPQTISPPPLRSAPAHSSFRPPNVDGLVLKDTLVVREFEDVFSKIPGLSPRRKIDFTIDLMPDATPISLPTYHMAPCEMEELRKQSTICSTRYDEALLDLAVQAPEQVVDSLARVPEALAPLPLEQEEVNAVMREIRILGTFDHKNVIPLKEILTSSDFLQDIDKDEQGNPVGYHYTGRIYLVLEYMDHTLEGLLSHRDAPFPAAHVKILDGLCYCHANRVLHRDIKDFSLSRWCPSDDSNEPNKDNTKLTLEVTSLWYRPPELLLQTKEDRDYGTSIDIWSVGCVFTKLLGQQVMEGENKAGFYIPNP
ncbi:uncharacterized protein LOC131218082 [Magnolia sinica]|uniref:uncharacterized protein LOC131218082 n=1 Tax=Magnolia sinica TaxID=86752 RepID=UPI002659220E|nr:uncharacterized protein LOC131218082 [Magnolia sinica]